MIGRCPRPFCGGTLATEPTEDGGLRSLCILCASERELRPPRQARWEFEAAELRADPPRAGRPKGCVTSGVTAALKRARAGEDWTAPSW